MRSWCESAEKKRPIVIFQTDGDESYNLQDPPRGRSDAPGVYYMSDIYAEVQRSRVRIYTLVPGEKLAGATEAELLRIAQEAVNNARKHAEATTLWVDLSVHPPRARLRVADDRRGLQEARRDSYGLHIMRERAESMGGRLNISEREGGGTLVDLELGLPPARTSVSPTESATEMSENA